MSGRQTLHERTYYFEVRVNWDKLMQIDQQSETFKAQIFFEATLLGRKHRPISLEEQNEIEKIFKRATIENSMAKPKEDGFPEMSKTKDADGQEVAAQPLKFTWLIHGEFSEELELRYFPFDTQDLSLTLRFGQPCREDKAQVRFINSPRSKVFLNVFTLKNASTEPQEIHVDFWFTKLQYQADDQFPLIQIHCNVGRKPRYYLVNVALPVFSIVMASGSSMTVDPRTDMSGRLGATLTLVLTAVAYKYLVAQMVPAISYNTLLDHYVLWCWLFLLLMVLENCMGMLKWWYDDEVVIGIMLCGAFLLFNLIFGIISYRIWKEESSRLTRRVPSTASAYERLPESDSEFPWCGVCEEEEAHGAESKGLEKDDPLRLSGVTREDLASPSGGEDRAPTTTGVDLQGLQGVGRTFRVMKP